MVTGDKVTEDRVTRDRVTGESGVGMELLRILSLQWSYWERIR